MNMLIHRLPRSLPIMWSRSKCHHCHSPLKAHHLIPILSYIGLKGRCAYCNNKISLRYPVVEIASILILFYTRYAYHGPINPWVITILLYALLVVFFTDTETFTIPNTITIPLTIFGGILAITNHTLADSALGWSIGFGVYLLIGVIAQLIYKKPAMGGGDMKLGGAIGTLLGAKLTALTIYFSFIFGGVIGIALILSKIKKRGDYIPFGPSIVIACFVAIHIGDIIWKYYFGS